MRHAVQPASRVRGWQGAVPCDDACRPILCAVQKRLNQIRPDQRFWRVV